MPDQNLHTRYGVKFSINVQPYESYTQTVPSIKLDGKQYAADTETAYKKQSGLHTYGKTKTVEMSEVQPFLGGGSIHPQNQRGFDEMDKDVLEKIENIRWAFGSTGELEISDSGVSLYTHFSGAGAVASVSITDGGEFYTTHGGGAFTTVPVTGGGTGMVGTIGSVSLATIGTATSTWHVSEPNATDPLRVVDVGNSYLLENYTVSAISPASGSGVTGAVSAISTEQGRLESGTITARGTNWKIGDTMTVSQSGSGGNGGILQVDRVASGGGEITAASITDGGSNYLVGDTMKVLQDRVIEDGPYGNTCEKGVDGVLTVASVSGTPVPLLEGIYLKNVGGNNIQLSLNDGDYYDIEIAPEQAFFSRLYNVSADEVKAKAVPSEQKSILEYMLFQGAG